MAITLTRLRMIIIRKTDKNTKPYCWRAPRKKRTGQASDRINQIKTDQMMSKNKHYVNNYLFGKFI